jgi:hypothetical protein
MEGEGKDRIPPIMPRRAVFAEITQTIFSAIQKTLFAPFARAKAQQW